MHYKHLIRRIAIIGCVLILNFSIAETNEAAQTNINNTDFLDGKYDLQYKIGDGSHKTLLKNSNKYCDRHPNKCKIHDGRALLAD